MASQPASPRKMLFPKAPSKALHMRANRPSKIIQKRETFIPYNLRDHKLTTHQHSWARSLAVSLSGWRNRQNFLKVRIEAHLQAEAKREAHKIARQATATSPLTENESTYISDSKQEVNEDECGVISNEEEFTHGDFNELVPIRVFKAQRKRELRSNIASKGDNTDDNTDEDEVDTNVDKPQARAPQVRSPSSMPAALVVQIAPDFDWKKKTHTGILRKKLSITKGWSAVTWNQKSNVRERLLLLEDDGYNITELQERKATSEEITAVILQRAAESQRPQVQIDSSAAQKPVHTNFSSNGHQSSLPTPQTSKTKQTVPPALAALSSSQNSPSSSREASKAAPKGPCQFDAVRQPSKAPAIEDYTQPFSLDIPYQPQASQRLKRKREHNSNSEDLEEVVVDAQHVRKKRKCTPLIEEDARLQALREIKQNILRRVFRPVRSIFRKSLPPSKVVFSAGVARPNIQMKQKTSTLKYLHGTELFDPHPRETLMMSMRGLDLMMNELHFLTNTIGDTVDVMSIYDPDYEGGSDHLPENAEARVRKQMQDFKRQQSHIAIVKDEQGRQVVQGDTLALAELLKVLRENNLLHLVEWKWDGLQLRSSESLQWSLSPETQSALLRAERQLRQHAHTGGVEVCILKMYHGNASRSC